MNSSKMNTPNLNIICYRWGTKYGVEYVNTLFAMVRRHLSLEHTFHCITDCAEGLQEGIVGHPLPDTGITGIWQKLMTFQDNFLGLQGQWVVSLDLDIVVVGSLDFLVEQPEHDFLIARNWSKDAKAGTGARGSGSVYRLKVGSHAFIWEKLIKNFDGAVSRYHGKNRDVGEQNWLNAHIEKFHYFSEGKVVSFKRHCHAKGHKFLGINTAKIGEAVPPVEAAVVSFHGDPLPPDVMYSHYGVWRHAPFVKQNWRPSRNELLHFGIVIPTYNRPDDLREALESLLAQSYPHWVAVIVNDASTVDYSGIEKFYTDDRFIFISKDYNGGINAARNVGIDYLTGRGIDFVSFLDDDDIFAPDFLENSISVIRQHPGYDWFMSNNYGERKTSQRDIESIKVIDWIDDYIYGKLRGDKAHLFAMPLLTGIRLDERFRASNRWRFFIDLNERTPILAYPNASIRKRYQDGGITKGVKGKYKGPKTLLETRSRFEKHAYVISKRPFTFAAYKYLLLELLKTPKRLVLLFMQ